MNIHITKEEFDLLMGRKLDSFIIGSRLYECETTGSDMDILVIYDSFFDNLDRIFNIRHQLQYKDEEHNTDYIFTTIDQFWSNLLSGESTINADLVIFDKTFVYDSIFRSMDFLRTYNIIKGYIGFARRDIKLIGKSKKDMFFHAARGLYIAECLLNKEMPNLKSIQNIKNRKWHISTKDQLIVLQESLRKFCNSEFENNNLKMYPDPRVVYKDQELPDLYLKLLESSNTKEFRYD